jgi:hypothetical protein
VNPELDNQRLKSLVAETLNGASQDMPYHAHNEFKEGYKAALKNVAAAWGLKTREVYSA